MSIELLAPVLIASLSALLSTPLLARLGAHGVRQWLAPEVIESLKTAKPIWWLGAVGLALAMTAGLHGVAEISLKGSLIAPALIGLSAALLIQLARIDARSRLLPDPLTLMLLASGLLFHALYFPGSLVDSVIGAVLGYSLLWALAKIFILLRGIEGMGRGDFAMTAGIGAWLGWQGLPIALLFASLVALMFAIFKHLYRGRPSALMSAELAFGPALSAGAALAWVTLG